MELVKRYGLTEAEFENFRRLINDASGIFFDRGKMDVLRMGLAERAEASGVSSLAEYYGILMAPGGEAELRTLLALLSVQETQFFRNLPQFDALQRYCIPEIVRRKSRGRRSIRIWSAGCSTGQEPYSIAMSLLDVLRDPSAWEVRVLGTDLNEEALDLARRGWYPERRLSGIDCEHQKRYLQPGGEGFTINEEVRQMVAFQRHNLVVDPLPIATFGTCDVVFCRNVIIYFTQETAKYVIEHFFDILNPGGYLFLGHSETLWKMSAKYSLAEIGDAFIYRKPLPRSLEGRRFIPERRMRDLPLPPEVERDRRRRADRRDSAGRSDTAGNHAAGPPGRRRRDGGGKGAKDLCEGGGSGRGAKDSCGGGADAQLREQGRMYLELGDYDKAMASLAESLTFNKTDEESWFLMGIAHERRDEPEPAMDCFRRAVFCNECFSLARFHLANAMERNGRVKGAIREYRNAARGFREHPPGGWENELEAYDLESLVSLCERKVEALSRD